MKEFLLTPTGIALVGLLAWNIITFFAYGWDKWKAKRGGCRRTPEKTLLLMAAVGGSVGAILGMNTWRHKTLHKKFSIGLPAILVAQILLVGGLVVYWKFFLI